MKAFESPELDIIRFCVEDIMTTSGREDELPIMPVGEIMNEFPVSLFD